MKRTLVIGASEKPERYSNMAIKKLISNGHEVFALAGRKGQVEGVVFETEPVKFEDIDTVTLYIGPKHQVNYADYIIKLKPKRVIFNPGTENDILAERLKNEGIEVNYECTLCLLSLGIF